MEMGKYRVPRIEFPASSSPHFEFSAAENSNCLRKFEFSAEENSECLRRFELSAAENSDCLRKFELSASGQL